MTLDDFSARQGQRIALERDFLLTRLQATFADDRSLVGRSADAMVIQALLREPEPRAWPRDKYDLARCERTYRLAPEHLKSAMLYTLERFRHRVRELQS